MRGQPPISFSVSAQSLFNGGGASTSTFDQEMGNSILGFWTVKSHLMPEEDEIISISAARFVHLTIVSEGPPPKRIAVRLWCEQLENDYFLVTLDPTEEGWKVSMWMDQQDLIIHNGTKQFRCQRVEESDVSESTKTALSKANEKMDSIEARN